MIGKVVITDAWLMQEEQCYLNPALKPYEEKLLTMKQSWHKSANHTPLSWYAEQYAELEPAAMLASLIPEEMGNFKQYWVVSPYHVRLIRSTLRLMPDSMLAWSEKEAEAVRDMMNPHLNHYGMKLFAVDKALILGCDREWDVAPENFADISGGLMTNTMPAGSDAGEWMRMLSELQMLLHQHPLYNAEGVQIHGLWLWGQATALKEFNVASLPAVATRNAYLQVVLRHLGKEQDAEMVISDSGHLFELLHERQALPADWLLLGSGKSVKLGKNIVHAGIAKIRAKRWKGI